MKFKQSIYFLISALLSLALFSCGSSSSDKVNNSEEFDKAQEESLKEQIKEVADNIPSPTEIPYMLQTTGADFNQSLVNETTKVDQYTSRNDKAALNLGVYAADVGYLASYEKTQDAITYLNSCKILAENLGIIGAFDMGILRRFESNIGNRDSLSVILDGAVKKTEDFLRNDQRNKLAALIITGSFVEGLYISTGLIKTYPKDMLPEDKRNLILTPLMRVVLQQKKSVSELSKMLSSLEQTEPVSEISKNLKSLETAYNALNIEEQIKNNNANLVLSDKNLLEITSIIENMRKNIVQ